MRNATKKTKAQPAVTPETVSAVMKMLGSKGGKAKVPKGVAALSKKERSKRGKEAAAARWKT
jgi:hypothetical protein